jgi:hypothetical protein
VYLDEHLPGTGLGHWLETNGRRPRWPPAGFDDDRVHLLVLVTLKVLSVGGYVWIVSLFHH